jgi:hypothetical protein
MDETQHKPTCKLVVMILIKHVERLCQADQEETRLHTKQYQHRVVMSVPPKGLRFQLHLLVFRHTTAVLRKAGGH